MTDIIQTQVTKLVERVDEELRAEITRRLGPGWRMADLPDRLTSVQLEDENGKVGRILKLDGKMLAYDSGEDPKAEEVWPGQYCLTSSVRINKTP